ncbi:MAG TPA: YqgE/AlgH family protein [Burkholderiales bacterium]|nr:YqgE/AlgH family protein [Burkholderiales bacterium]
MTAIRPLIGLILLSSALAATVGVVPARAAEPSDETVILVAKPALRDRLYGATILISKPIGNGQHIGLIVNKPTPMTLGRLFPGHGPSLKVTDPVYLGGPVSTEVIFALVQRDDSPGNRSMQLTPNLFLVLDRDLVDRVIEAEADHARFFAGMVLWRPGELRAELDRGFWYVLDADANLVLRKSTIGMWEELVKRSEQQKNLIRTRLDSTEPHPGMLARSR